MLYCYGDGCPLRLGCYRATQPITPRDAFGAPPFNTATGECTYFVSNEPSDEMIRVTAYYLWLREGQPAGRSAAHWATAARQCAASLGRPWPDED